MAKPNYPIGSVDRALTLLLLIGKRGEIRLTDAANELDVAQSTAHRLLAMLQYHELVTQDDLTKLYRRGPGLIELGVNVARSLDLRAVAAPHLAALRDRTESTVHLAVLQGGDVLFLDSLEPEAQLRVVSRTGMSMPAYAASIGKALLAELDDNAVRGLYGQHLRALTANTVTDLEELLAQLKLIRDRGWAVNQSEAEEGVSSVGAAIRSDERTYGAISVAMPSFRFDRYDLVELAELTSETAGAIADDLP